MTIAATRIVRGATVEWTAEFFDSAGSPTNPASATLTVRYRNTSGQVTEDTIAMTNTLFVWRALWESALAQPGVVPWSIKSSGATKAAQQGNLTIVANPAN